MNKNLIAESREAAKLAYAPYSNFHVGAAVLCDDGTIVRGCNIENASYGLTVCAERSALFSAITQGKKPVEIAVTCPSAGDAPAEFKMPCGACRQVMVELLPKEAIVQIDGVEDLTVEALLPRAFTLRPR